MKSFISWSGGKDCMYALHLFLKDKRNEVACLLNMCSADGERSGSHGLSRGLIRLQAEAMHIPVVQQPIEDENYEYSFKKAITELKEQGVDSGVFGDIYLQEHRDWIERVCRETGITPVFPLWKKDTEELMRSLIAEGFKTVVVAVRKEKLSGTFLGRQINGAFLADISAVSGADPCGENGEYHTFVFDGPLFDHAMPFSKKREYEDGRHWFLEIE
jgi:Predicted ATPases of PP-loop superfamily